MNNFFFFDCIEIKLNLLLFERWLCGRYNNTIMAVVFWLEAERMWRLDRMWRVQRQCQKNAPVRQEPNIKARLHLASLIAESEIHSHEHTQTRMGNTFIRRHTPRFDGISSRSHIEVTTVILCTSSRWIVIIIKLNRFAHIIFFVNKWIKTKSQIYWLQQNNQQSKKIHNVLNSIYLQQPQSDFDKWKITHDFVCVLHAKSIELNFNWNESRFFFSSSFCQSEKLIVALECLEFRSCIVFVFVVFVQVVRCNKFLCRVSWLLFLSAKAKSETFHSEEKNLQASDSGLNVQVRSNGKKWFMIMFLRRPIP